VHRVRATVLAARRRNHGIAGLVQGGAPRAVGRNGRRGTRNISAAAPSSQARACANTAATARSIRRAVCLCTLASLVLRASSFTITLPTWRRAAPHRTGDLTFNHSLVPARSSPGSSAATGETRGSPRRDIPRVGSDTSRRSRETAESGVDAPPRVRRGIARAHERRGGWICHSGPQRWNISSGILSRQTPIGRPTTTVVKATLLGQRRQSTIRKTPLR
jgi:hypothetical protein